MKIWKIEADLDVAEGLVLENSKDMFTRLNPCIVGKRIELWEELKVYTSGRKETCDFFKLLGYPVVNKKTIDVLQPFLAETTQFLPLIYNDTGVVYILNVINVVDCLNHDQSMINRFSDGGVMSIDKYSFHNEKVSNHHIFKIPELLKGSVFVSDEFKSSVESNGLRGFKFIEVWESDESIVREREERYAFHLRRIQTMIGKEYPFDEAIPQIRQGKAFVSDKWKLQLNQRGEIILGQLNENGDYNWLVPVYYPPILLGLMWKETEPSDL